MSAPEQPPFDPSAGFASVVITRDQIEAVAAVDMQQGLPLPGETCDFCCGPDPVWEYPAGDTPLALGRAYDQDGYVVVDRTVTSRGNWGACAACGDLIEAGDWPAVTRRCLKSPGYMAVLEDSPPGTRVRLRAVVTATHGIFRAARLPEPRKPFMPRDESSS